MSGGTQKPPEATVVRNQELVPAHVSAVFLMFFIVGWIGKIVLLAWWCLHEA